ncbi:MAG: hypothetical protein IPI35_34845 [Deltaproteobacteria bacterium]|nr:hypothetical protein [Deltaproteobacteria bacterium]
MALVVAIHQRARQPLAADQVKVTVGPTGGGTDPRPPPKAPPAWAPSPEAQRGALGNRLQRGRAHADQRGVHHPGHRRRLLEPKAVLAQPTFGGGLTLFTRDGAPGEKQRVFHGSLRVHAQVVCGTHGRPLQGPSQAWAWACSPPPPPGRVDRQGKLALALEDGVRLHLQGPGDEPARDVGPPETPRGRLVGLSRCGRWWTGGRPKDAEALVARIAEHMADRAYRVPHVQIEVQGVLTENNPSAGLVR